MIITNSLKPIRTRPELAVTLFFSKPLPAGEHNLHVTARVLNPVDPSFNYDYDASYDLKVR